jgi:hypothetical protein
MEVAVVVVVLVIIVVVAVADEVKVEAEDVITINKDLSSNHMQHIISGHVLLTSIFLGMHNGSHVPLLLVLILQSVIGKDQ